MTACEVTVLVGRKRVDLFRAIGLPFEIMEIAKSRMRHVLLPGHDMPEMVCRVLPLPHASSRGETAFKWDGRKPVVVVSDASVAGEWRVY